MRRGRPLGLSIALWACTVLYGLYPLAEAAFYLVMVTRRSSIQVPSRVLLGLVLSVGFLLLMIPAWLGRPPQIRLVLTAAVLTLMVINLGFALGDLLTQPEGIIADSATDLNRAANACAIPLYVLITAYIVWYLNRYPSRAYYSGREQ